MTSREEKWMLSGQSARTLWRAYLGETLPTTMLNLADRMIKRGEFATLEEFFIDYVEEHFTVGSGQILPVAQKLLRHAQETAAGVAK